MIALAFVLSFGAAVVVTRSDPSGAFFLLPTRAWELLGGGIVFLLVQGRALTPVVRDWLEKGGLLLIVASVLVFDKATAWPGWRAMLPVIAAMMVVAANNQSPLTGNRAAQWIGDRSYSLYRWHWPVCVALLYLEMHRAPLAVAAGLVATLLLGQLSYDLVENKAKASLGPIRWRSGALIGVTVLAAALPGIAIWKKQGVPGRFPGNIDIAASEAQNFNPRRVRCHIANGASSPSCIYGGAERKVILAGDSHADAVVTSLAQADPTGKAGVVQWSYSGCPYVPGMQLAPSFRATVKHDYQCVEFNDWVRSQLDSLPADIPVVIVGRYSDAAKGHNDGGEEREIPAVYFSTVYARSTPEYLSEFGANVVRTACEAARKRPVYLMRPLPEMGVDVPKTMARRLSFGGNGDVSISIAQYLSRNAWIIAAQEQARATCGVKILDPLPYLCQNGRCFGTRAGRSLYFDDDHLSEYGNKLLTPMFAEVFKGR